MRTAAVDPERQVTRVDTQRRRTKTTMAATTMKENGKRLVLLVVIALLGLVALAGPVAGQEDSGSAETVSFDIAEDMTRFVFDGSNVFEEDGLPTYGSTFITQGYIYPAGTLNGTNGVLADGSPEFPELVIGEWTCRGWMVGEGAHTTTGAMVVTTQIYSFGDVLGAETIVTDGFELVDAGIAIERAITGGTGKYAGVEGSMQQTFLGLNASEGFNLSVEFTLAQQ